MCLGECSLLPCGITSLPGREDDVQKPHDQEQLVLMVLYPKHDLPAFLVDDPIEVIQAPELVSQINRRTDNAGGLDHGELVNLRNGDIQACLPVKEHLTHW